MNRTGTEEEHVNGYYLSSILFLTKPGICLVVAELWKDFIIHLLHIFLQN